jgi:hypothetical protein
MGHSETKGSDNTSVGTTWWLALGSRMDVMFRAEKMECCVTGGREYKALSNKHLPSHVSKGLTRRNH